VIVRNGGLLDCGESVVGYGAGGTEGTVCVEGLGSLWINAGALTLGRAGGGNRLTIASGGTVENTAATIGSQSHSNTAFISGSGSLWRVNGALTVGGAGYSGNALIMGGGGMVTVSDNAAVNAGNAVTNNVSGYPGGLDLTKSTATFTLNGAMAVNFTGDPHATGLYWGFRWAGNHTNALQQFIDAGSLTVEDADLAPFLRGKAGLHYDGTNSYVGLFVSRVPLPSEHSTVILIR
jgi:T5SS/PEP-CTERM-associated repeat protein